MSTTTAERTINIPFELRSVFINTYQGNASIERVVRVPQLPRIVYIKRLSTSSDRTIYVTEE
jgi:hypothetical protein